MTNKKLSKKLARSIFEYGNAPKSKCKRIQFMGGKWPDNEINNGGCVEVVLAYYLNQILSKIKPE